eukprot:IDg15510t1
MSPAAELHGTSKSVASSRLWQKGPGPGPSRGRWGSTGVSIDRFFLKPSMIVRVVSESAPARFATRLES